MYSRFLVVGYGLLVLLTGCSGEGNPEPNPPPTPHSLAQQAYIKASNTEINDRFGRSLELAGDTLVVGAPNESSAATGVNGDEGDNLAVGSGAVYVFVRGTGGWIQQAYVKASNTGDSDNFGFSVAVDGNTLVVGAPFEDSSAKGVNGNGGDNGATDSGAVYVFTRTNGIWTQQAYIKASNAEAHDSFGNTVDVSGDTLVVGAPTLNKSLNNSGAVYVYVRSNGVWEEQAVLQASNAEAGDSFGANVKLVGDTLAVGAPLEDSSATGIDGDQSNDPIQGVNNDSGAVYVFTRDNGSWTQQAYVKASNTDAADFFGSQIALDDNTLAVGAASEDNGAKGIDHNQNGKSDEGTASNSGAVYVFTRSGMTWSQQAYVKASNVGFSDGFGRSVALTKNTLAVGAWREGSRAMGINGNGDDNSSKDSGAAYVFTRSGATWMQQAYVKASNTDAGDLFGMSVALDGGTVVVGAPFEASRATGINDNTKQGDNSAPQSGAVYVMQ